jgi:hypothetical protein
LRVGLLEPGDRLPKVGEVAESLAINPNTVLEWRRWLNLVGRNLQMAQTRWQRLRSVGRGQRQRFLRFHAVLFALLTSPFLLSLPLSLIFLPLILTLDSCILILLV